MSDRNESVSDKTSEVFDRLKKVSDKILKLSDRLKKYLIEPLSYMKQSESTSSGKRRDAFPMRNELTYFINRLTNIL